MFNSMLSKIALGAAGGAIAAMTASAPALAQDTTPAPPAQQQAQQQADESGMTIDSPKRTYKGQVIAKTGLNVHSGPSTDYKVIDTLAYGEYVKIKCKITDWDEAVDGNPRWYKLEDGKWAWATARYIRNVGAAPAPC